jgi:hypothetical protein
VAEVPGIDDHTDVLVLSGQLAELSDGSIGRGVVDEEVVVFVPVKFGHRGLDLVTDGSNVSLLVVAGSEDR